MPCPLTLFNVENAGLNHDVWQEIPDDFHQIVSEEGAIYDLEFFPGTPAMSALGTPKLLARA